VGEHQLLFSVRLVPLLRNSSAS